MLSDDAVLRRLEPGNSLLVGTVDASGWPACCRAVALAVHEDRQRVTVYVPVSTSGEVVENAAATGRVAVLSSNPVDHVSLQLKGRAVVRQAEQDEAAAVEECFARFVEVLASLGLPRGVTSTVCRWPAHAIELTVEALFEQTPGPRAGARLRTLDSGPAAGETAERAPDSRPGTCPAAEAGRGAADATSALASPHPRCYQGIVPSLLATASADGTPNITYVSQVLRVDDRHVALSRQFFDKTARNLAENPRAAVEVYDPVTFEAWRLRLALARSETSGPLFDAMALRIQAIASHTGMSGIFALKAADVFAIERLEAVTGFRSAEAGRQQDDALALEGHRSELRGLLCVSERICRASGLNSLLDGVLEALDSFFGFRHAMVLLADERSGRLVAAASRGYGEAGRGAEVAPGEGVIGTVARERRVLRISGLDQELSYGRAVRRQLLSQDAGGLSAEVPPPGLGDARSALVIPLVSGDRLLGVLAAESRDPARFDEWHEAYLEVLGNQIALALERSLAVGHAQNAAGPAAHHAAAHAAEPTLGVQPPAAVPRRRAGDLEATTKAPGRHHRFVFYRNDDCVFVDGEYLIRNVPGRILWKLLCQHREGRSAFTNRELRLDSSLGLPELRDNLESRLVLLRRRLEQKCPDLRLVSTGRGRFRLEVDGAVELVERDSA